LESNIKILILRDQDGLKERCGKPRFSARDQDGLKERCGKPRFSARDQDGLKERCGWLKGKVRKT
jgi:hypothetical protein